MASTKIKQWNFGQTVKILPEEMWLYIGEYLTEPDDLVNFSKSASELEDFLLSAYPSLYFTEVFPQVAQHLEFRDIKICRRICRIWNKKVLKYLDGFYDNVSDFPLTFHADREYEPGDVNIVGLVEIERWENEMNPMLTNPVACRSLRLKPMVGDDTHTFIAGCTDILSTWGHHIWNLKITNIHINSPPMADILSTIEYLEFVQSCLRHVPNLKTLNLYHSQRIVEVQPVQEWMAAHLFPPLPFLRHLNLNLNPWLSHIAWEGAVTEYKSHLESLDVQFDQCYIFLENPNIKLPQLTKLKLSAFRLELSQILRLAERSRWNLKSLDIFPISVNPLSNEWRNDFQQLLEHSKSSLETLRIRMNYSDEPDDLPDETLFVGITLPQLKLLRIDYFDLKSLEFLIKFSPNLKRLRITEDPVSNFVHFPRNRQLQLSKIQRVYEPNEWRKVWNHLQFLETVDISWYTAGNYRYAFNYNRNDFIFESRQ